MESEIILEFLKDVAIKALPQLLMDLLPQKGGSGQGTPIESEDLARDEIYQRFVLRSSIPYSFSEEEFIHPLVVREMMGTLSDSHQQVIGVDLDSSNQSDRFHGDFSVVHVQDRQRRRRVIWEGSQWDENERESFSYRHIATSPSGIEIVLCANGHGGTLVSVCLALFCFERDLAVGQDLDGNILNRERTLLKVLGTIALGDRYDGRIKYEDGVLKIGSDPRVVKRGSRDPAGEIRIE